MLTALLIASVFVSLTALAAASMITIFSDKILLEERVRTYVRNNKAINWEAGAEKKKKSVKTVLRPYWEQASSQMSKSLSVAKKRELNTMLRDAGSPLQLSATEFRLMQMVLSIGGAFFAFLFFAPIADDMTTVWLLAAALGLLAYRYPIFYLGRRKTMRIQQINREMPDFFDTLNLLIEAGLGLDAAISNVCRKKTGPLAEEFLLALEEMKLGKSRKEAFYELRKRVPSPAFQSIITSLLQADQFGIGMTKILKSLTVRIREQQREAVREQAMKAPVKMLFPMVFLIFPSLFIVILGPLIVRFVTKGLTG